MAYGLAALSGLLRGLEGFPQGLIAADKLQLQREQLAELTRAHREAERLRAEAERLRREALEETKFFHRGTLLAPERAAARERDQMRALGVILGMSSPASPERAEHELETPPSPERQELSRLLQSGGIPKAAVGGLLQTILKPAKPATPAESVHAARLRVAKARAAGIQPEPEDVNLVNLSSQAIVVPERGVFPKTTVLGKESESVLESGLSPEAAGAVGVTFGTPRSQAVGKVPLTAAQRTKIDAINTVKGQLDFIEKEIAALDLPQTASSRVTRAPGIWLRAYGQTEPRLAALRAFVEGTLAPTIRALGDVGALTDLDIERARVLMPILAPTVRGIGPGGIIPAPMLPDTLPVIHQKLANLRQLLNQAVSSAGIRSTGEATLPSARDLGLPPGFKVLRKVR